MYNTQFHWFPTAAWYVVLWELVFWFWLSCGKYQGWRNVELGVGLPGQTALWPPGSRHTTDQTSVGERVTLTCHVTEFPRGSTYGPDAHFPFPRYGFVSQTVAVCLLGSSQLLDAHLRFDRKSVNGR